MTRVRWILAWLVACVVLAAGVVTFVHSRQTTVPTPKLPPMAAMPFVTSIDTAGPTTVNLGGKLTFSVGGYTKAGIESVALYDGATKMSVVAGSRLGTTSTVTMPAMYSGRHLVYAEVTSTDGEVATTTPTEVSVTPLNTKRKVPIAVDPLPKETVNAFAERLGVSVKQISFASPMRPTSVIPAGIQPVVKVDPLSGLKDAWSTQPVINNGALLESIKMPKLEATVRQCTVKLKASQVADDVKFYRGSTGTPGWIELKNTSKQGTSMTLTQLPAGPHVFFVRSQGALDSNHVAVTVPQVCAADLGWTGDASLINGILSVPKPLSNAVAYLSADGKPAQRLPFTQSATLGNIGSITDVSQNIPAFYEDAKVVQLTVYENKGDLQIQRASGVLKVPDGLSVADIIGEPRELGLEIVTDKAKGETGPNTEINVGPDDRKITFAWRSGSERFTKVRWQVLSQPVPASDTSLTSPALIASGESKADDSVAGIGGSFTVNTADIPWRPSKKTAESMKPAAVTSYVPISPSAVLTSTKPVFSPRVDDLNAAAGLISGLPMPGAGEPVYVRVVGIAKDGGSTAASPTNTVVLPLPATKDTQIDLKITSMSAYLGRAPNPAQRGCLEVTVPWVPSDFAGSADVTFAARFYPTSRVYCPRDFPPPDPSDCWVGIDIVCETYAAVESFVKGVIAVFKEMYTLFTAVYNGIVDGIVEMVAKFNPICVGLTAASSGAGKGCETVVGIATKAAITAVATAYGIPPTLPTMDELQAMAEGNLAEIAVAAMKQLGVPCDEITPPAGLSDSLGTLAGEMGVDKATATTAGQQANNPCLAMATLMIGAVKDTVKSSTEQGIAAAAGLPYFPGVGMSMKVDPRSLPDPAIITVTAKPTSPTADLDGVVVAGRIVNPHAAGGSYPNPFTSWPFPYNRAVLLLKPTGPFSLAGTAVATPANEEILVPDYEANLGLASINSWYSPTTTMSKFPNTARKAKVGPLK